MVEELEPIAKEVSAQLNSLGITSEFITRGRPLSLALRGLSNERMGRRDELERRLDTRNVLVFERMERQRTTRQILRFAFAKEPDFQKRLSELSPKAPRAKRRTASA